MVVVIFVLMGIGTMSWFIRQFNTKEYQSDLRIVTKFYFTRFMNTAIFYYLIVAFYLIYLNYIASDEIKEDVQDQCNNGIFAHAHIH